MLMAVGEGGSGRSCYRRATPPILVGSEGHVAALSLFAVRTNRQYRGKGRKVKKAAVASGWSRRSPVPDGIRVSGNAMPKAVRKRRSSNNRLQPALGGVGIDMFVTQVAKDV